MNDRSPDSLGITSVLAIARDVAFIASVYLAFAGFLYHYFYLSAFGIPFTVGTVGASQVLVYSYAVFSMHPWPIIVILAAGVAAYLLISLITQYRRILVYRRMLQSVVILVAALLLFPAVYAAASSAAQDVAIEVRSGQSGNTAHLHFAQDQVGRYTTVATDSERDQLTIVAETGDRYFVLDQHRSPSANQCLVPDSKVYAVPRGAVSYIALDVLAFNRQSDIHHFSLSEILRRQEPPRPCVS